ncbi:MAG: carbon monoxide dehydrogenase subunit G, partial [Gammaproteobacteria bacterium]|nr:carbon monoxide dehydrogenase subunit G [Gammaproteobacteria bacterium]
MDLTGEYRIAAPKEKVWKALNDPEVLAASIMGCEKIEKLSDTEFVATVAAKVGPLRAKFDGKVTLSNIDAPNSYTLSGEGQGSGGVGFAKGSVDVSLAEDGNETVLSYSVDATVGGKLAQIGSRLIDGVARQQAKHFFSRFSEQFAAAPAEAKESPAAAPAPQPVAPPA